MVASAAAGNQIAEVTESAWYLGHVVGSRGVCSIQFLRKQFVYQLRIGLALGRLHDLTDEESEHGFLPGAVLFELLGVVREDLVDDLFERGCIA
jgi:hypothetical protein